MRNRIIISCEHAGNHVPLIYKSNFLSNPGVLETHRGYDIGALGVAKYISKKNNIHLHYQKLCRLIIECNRSLHHPELFSEFTKNLSEDEKEVLKSKYYEPYRSTVCREIEKSKNEGFRTIHISIHSFTPVLNNQERLVDIGLLFDENRNSENQFCNKWKDLLTNDLPDLLTLHNCPYHGTDDGFTTYLRTRFSDNEYLGIEIEINQKYANTLQIITIQKALTQTLKQLL